MNKDDLVISRIEDRIQQCRDGYYVTATDFLDSHEQTLAVAAAKRAAEVRTFLYGGYDDAERRMLVCVPADFPLSDEEAKEGLLQVLRVSYKPGGKERTHRHYLGSMLGLGLDRRVTGDILVRENGADIIILPEIADFLLQEYTHIGRTDITTEIVPAQELILPEQKTEFIRDTVPSARLDTIVSSAFKVSRAKAVEAIKAGLVSVDHIEVLKPDARVEEGVALVLKGKGKAVLREFGGESKKGRLWVTIERYL